MAGKIPNDLRDEAITRFRGQICAKLEIIPFPHQARWWGAADGLILVEGIQADPGDPLGTSVRLPDGSIERWATLPRPGGRARVVADLGAFKIGKSYGAAIWAAAFGVIPQARVNLVGLEYDICAPEFDYIVEALLSAKGLGLKYDSLQNRPRDGKMWLDLPNGCRFEARSWERKESLKGKEIDAYLYCEAYQLPGIECYTSFSQNLRVRDGYAIFATTPDRPWVQEIHDRAHSGDPSFRKWECVCGVDASVNMYSYDAEARVRDQHLMTREKFAIHYGGQLGDFVGRVFNYQRGQHQFRSDTHPNMFRGGNDRENLILPREWDIVSGIDTGTYYTALTVAFSPGGDAFVLEEFPNYRYVAGSAERDENITIPEWAKKVSNGVGVLGGRLNFWADANSQFKRELRAYGLNLLSATQPVETRTEIAREYFQKGRLWLAPWLEVLPFELENACWPEEASSTGKFARVKDRDHTLDCLEHVLSRRPRGKPVESISTKGRWLDSFVGKHAVRHKYGNSSLGIH